MSPEIIELLGFFENNRNSLCILSSNEIMDGI